MPRHSLLPRWLTRLLLLAVAVLALLLLLPNRQALSQQVREVFISNFPQTQRVIGSISIKEPIPTTKTFRINEVVSPVARHETVHFIDGGTVDANGFRTVTVTLYGWMKSGTFQAGDIGVLLIPDEEVFERARDEADEILLPIEVKAAVDPSGTGYFASQETFSVGFPSYRVFFYNGSTKSAEANLRVYFGQ